MAVAERVCLAVVTGAHGLAGEVRLRTFTGEPEAVAAYGPLEDASGRSRLRITSLRVTTKDVIARFDGIADRTAAEGLKGTELWLPRERLPEPDDDEWYVADLQGLDVVDQGGRLVGRVRAVTDHGAGDVVEILAPDGKELVLPFTRNLFPDVDPVAGRMVMAPNDVLEAASR
ncbi:MAG: ribosome maturation factor RimM [Pseudomonadota bacterium]